MGRRGSRSELAGVLIHGLEGTASPLSAVPAVGCSNNLQRVSHKPLNPRLKTYGNTRQSAAVSLAWCRTAGESFSVLALPRDRRAPTFQTHR